MKIVSAQRRDANYRIIVNFIVAQVSWWACVLGGASDLALAGTALVGIGIVRHIVRAAQPRRELMLIGVTTALGAIFDTTLMQLGWIQFAHGIFIPGFAPHWMLALWASFATTFNLSLAWLKPHLPLAAILGAISGPAVYAAGVRLGAARWLEPQAALLAIGIAWALLMPALLFLARYYDGYIQLREMRHGQ